MVKIKKYRFGIALLLMYIVIPNTAALSGLTDTVDIILGEYSEIMDIGTTQVLAIQVESASTEDEITVISNAPDVVSVDEQKPEKLTAISSGTAEITIKYGSTKKEITITVSDPYVPVTGINIESYSATMLVGETDYIMASALPSNATNKTISFSSSDESILTVSNNGLITAVSAGTAVIDIYAENECTSVTITVNRPSVIAVDDIDIDYQSSMTVGTSQLIIATVIPSNANEQTITFSSSDSSILMVNAVGRVYAQKVGTAEITLTVDNIVRTISITAQSNEQDMVVDVGTEKIWPTSIDVADFTGKLAVNDTTTINATVYPTDATEQQLTYSSSNTDVATVSAGGRITGVSKGTCTITVMAGGISKTLSLTVYTKTSSFDINKLYVMLQPKKNYQLEVTASPEDADQSFTYTSTNSSIITVDESGLITAISEGSASVIIKNYDSEAVVTVVVNNSTGVNEIPETEFSETITDYNNDLQMLATMIQAMDEGETISIYGDSLEILSVDILSALYERKSKLQVLFSGYTLLIDGALLKNPGNELNPIIAITVNGKKAEFILNDGNNLPGSVTITLLDYQDEFKYLYLLNTSTGKYEILNNFDGYTMQLDTAGSYMMVTSIYKESKVNWIIIFLCDGISTIGVVTLIIYRNRHWFW